MTGSDPGCGCLLQVGTGSCLVVPPIVLHATWFFHKSAASFDIKRSTVILEARVQDVFPSIVALRFLDFRLYLPRMVSQHIRLNRVQILDSDEFILYVELPVRTGFGVKRV